MHRNAPLTPEGRLRLCRLIEDGWTVASAAESMRISRQTAHKWWRRYQEAGEPASGTVRVDPDVARPRRRPRWSAELVELRRPHQVGPARLAARAGVPASTLHRIWARHGVSRLSDLERRAGRVIRRIETSRPGELVHIDIKKQAKIPPGGGWRVHGRANVALATARPDDPRRRLRLHPFRRRCPHRLAYSEVHANEQAVTAIAFWRRARAFFASYGITVERVITDNGTCYRSKDFAAELVDAAIAHTRTRPYCPRPTAKSSATTGPSSTNGPMPGPTAQRRPGPGHSTRGSTCTTITGTTLPSRAHPSVASTTWLGRTTSPA